MVSRPIRTAAMALAGLMVLGGCYAPHAVGGYGGPYDPAYGEPVYAGEPQPYGGAPVYYDDGPYPATGYGSVSVSVYGDRDRGYRHGRDRYRPRRDGVRHGYGRRYGDQGRRADRGFREGYRDGRRARDAERRQDRRLHDGHRRQGIGPDGRRLHGARDRDWAARGPDRTGRGERLGKGGQRHAGRHDQRGRRDGTRHRDRGDRHHGHRQGRPRHDKTHGQRHRDKHRIGRGGKDRRQAAYRPRREDVPRRKMTHDPWNPMTGYDNRDPVTGKPPLHQFSER